MAVAKSYENYKLGEPFTENGRKYVNATCSCDHCCGTGIWAYGPFGGTCFKCGGSGKLSMKVRWYTDAERARMDIATAKRAEEASIKHQNELDRKRGPEYNNFGNQDGFITLILGNTYPIKDELKEAGCRYSSLFGWYVPNDINYTSTLETYKLFWNQISKDNLMLEESVVKEIVTGLIRKPSLSTFIGEIGEKIQFAAKVTSNRSFETRYGICRAIVFQDQNENVYVWYTAAKDLPEGSSYEITGTIKDHSEYKGVKQTILTRCKVREI